MHNSKPYIIQFPKIGQPSLGYISLAEKEDLPFTPKRIYWTYFTPEAVAGEIIVTTELKDGTIEKFILDSPDKGLFIPKMCWRTMKYTHNAVQICIASVEYDVIDYIREYKDFLKV